MLSVQNLSKRYGGTLALDQVSLKIPQGQMVAIIGKSGAGKSTFLRLMNRLIEPSDGQITFAGQDITRLRGAELRRWRAQAAMIFQGFNLSPRLDVLTNVMVGASTEIPQLRRLLRLYNHDERLRAATALDDLGLIDKALERAEHLSGGQQQRVAIARALMQSPRLILADEPVASLDPGNTRRVMDTLRWINGERGITVICNLHSIDLARSYADRVIGLLDGRLVFDGPADALTNDALTVVYGEEFPAAAEDARSAA
jgi:phosphonate transport system ATP-binding protein